MKRINPLIQTGIVGSVLIVFSVAAKAQLPPNAYAYWIVSAASGSGAQVSGYTVPSDNSLLPAPPVLGSALAVETGTLGSDPSVSASATATGYAVAGESTASAESELVFSFSIVNLGFGTATSIPVIATGSGYASWSAAGSDNILYAHGLASASAIIGTVNANGDAIPVALMSWDIYANTSSTTSGQVLTFNLNPFTANLSTGETYGMELNVDVSAFGDGAGVTGTGTGYVDPQVMIDPTFAQASDYEIIFSPGVTVPEPSAVAMLVLGGAAFLCVRRVRGRFAA